MSNCDVKINLPSGEQCVGCGACYNSCSTGAVKMVPDAEGFLYPKINNDLCVNCKACEKACPEGKISFSNTKPKAYYAYSKDLDVLQGSSSGGTFSHIAQYILSQNGAVIGAAFDKSYVVYHTVVESIDDLYKLRTSKYVQSDTNDVYLMTKKLLKEGRYVLFTGTPCQTAALRQYLSKDYDNLYVQDIICHGVPSPGVWQEYLSQAPNSSEISSVSFRDKTEGWGRYSVKFTYNDNTEHRELASNNIYIKAFLSNLSLRPSCYSCKFKGLGRVSDITLADYWGVSSVHPELANVQGVSLILTHSEKGEKLLSKINNDVILGDTQVDAAIAYNSSAIKGLRVPGGRKKFFKNYEAQPMESLVHELTKPTLKSKTVSLVAKIISKLR